MVLLLQLMSWHSGAHEPPLLSACLYACLWPLRSLCNRNADATEFAIWSLCYAVSMPVTVSTVLRHCCLYSVSLLGLRRTSPDSPKPLLQGSSKSWVSLVCGRLGAEFTSSQRDPCNPRVQRGQPGSSQRMERPIFWMKVCCVCVHVSKESWGTPSQCAWRPDFPSAT